MKYIFKIDFNTDTKIVLAVLERFRSYKTNFKYQIRTLAFLNTKVYIVF